MAFKTITLTALWLTLVPGLAAAATSTDTITEAFGMNLHLRQRIPQAEWTTVLELADEAGVQWAREQFNWDVLEPVDDSFDFDTYDAVMSAYQAQDVQVLGLLTYSSSWASSNTGATDYEFYPPDLDAWENYVGTVAEHFAGQIDYWEIWNEPNHAGFWKGSTQEYVDLFEVASAAITAANPDAVVVLGGLSGSDSNYLDTVYETIADKTMIDVVAIHPYREAEGSFNHAPETVVDGLNTLTNDLYNMKAVMNLNGQSDTPIWLTEVGWTTADAGVSDRRQSEFLTRLYIEALVIPKVDKIFWYSFNDTSDDESYLDAHFGLVEDDYTTKPALTAYDYAKQHLNGRYFKDQTLPGAQVVDDFSASQGWEFAGTVCTDGSLNDHSNGVMQVSYKFTATSNCYAPITLNEKLPDPTRALQFKVKGDNDNTFLRVRLVDATGEIFQYNLGYMPSEWLYYVIQLDQVSSYWGGDKDGLLDQPLTLNAFVLDDTDGSLEQGELSFDDVLATPKSHTYLYRFHKDNKDVYAYWTSKQKRDLTVHLAGAGKMREYRFNKDSVLHESGSTDYKIKSDRVVKFLQTL